MAPPPPAPQLVDSTNHNLNNGLVEVSLKPTMFDNNNHQENGHNKADTMFQDDVKKDAQVQDDVEPIKCSAIHSLERDMPDFDYSNLVDELRFKILKDNEENPGWFSQVDIERCRNDQWFIQRFLLRQKLDVEAAFNMMRKALRFRNESLTHSIKRHDFPAEFYKTAGLFPYEEDRKGNKMLYIRVKVHKKVHEINLVLQAFLYYNINYCDELAKGRGMSIVFDCTGGGLANADMDMLLVIVSTLVNYFPKGLSYLLVHNLPWILKPFWHIAKAWIAEEHTQLVKFSDQRTIYEYVDKDKLPDFMGGTCKVDYTAPPENCTTLEEAAKMWGLERSVIRKVLVKFADHLPPDTLEKFDHNTSMLEENLVVDKNDSDEENKP